MLRLILFASLFSLLAVSYFGLSDEAGVFNSIVMGLAASFLVLITLTFGTRSLRYAIPWHIKAVADLITYVESSDQIVWTRDAVAKKVRSIVIEQLGLKESAYREDARFIEDLGMD